MSDESHFLFLERIARLIDERATTNMKYLIFSKKCNKFSISFWIKGRHVGLDANTIK